MSKIVWSNSISTSFYRGMKRILSHSCIKEATKKTPKLPHCPENNERRWTTRRYIKHVKYCDRLQFTMLASISQLDLFPSGRLSSFSENCFRFFARENIRTFRRGKFLRSLLRGIFFTWPVLEKSDTHFCVSKAIFCPSLRTYVAS